MRLRTELAAVALFVAFGLCVEIVFTGLAEGAGGSFRGQVSLLMIPVYAVAWALLGPGLRALRGLGLDAARWRLPITVVAIYAVEWSFGTLYAEMGLWPWRYSHDWASDFSGGHVTLLYLPFWLGFAALLPPVHRAIRAAAPRLAGG
ncbi:MAG TPA: hypothetical protein VKB65_03850 [Myxococcota bacterium]|nr:hypothetical protein [Myxococcota bacterium]